MFEAFVREMNRYDAGVHRLVPGAQPASIDRAEEALGVVFPPDLRAFLLRWNGGLLFAKEFHDITLWHIDDPETDALHEYSSNIVRNNLILIRKFDHPAELLAFASLSYGSLACVDLSSPGRVVECDRASQVEDEYDSLEDWLDYHMADGATLYDTHGDMLEP